MLLCAWARTRASIKEMKYEKLWKNQMENRWINLENIGGGGGVFPFVASNDDRFCLFSKMGTAALAFDSKYVLFYSFTIYNTYLNEYAACY